MMKKSIPLFFLVAFALLAIGCADPAADKPAAEVSEPAAAPAPAPAAGDAVTYKLSPESKIGFIGSKVTGSHNGGFTAFEGEVSVVGGAAAGASVDVAIDTTSLWADNDNLTGHLKSADFFDVETHPTASFQSTEITTAEDGSSTVTGNLNLHGVTKQISFPATITVTADGFSAQAEFSIKRFDFGIEYAGKADDLIRDDVVIQLDLKSAS